MTRITHAVSTPDGRTLEVVEDGAPEGPVLLGQHGTPGSAALYRSEIAGAEQLGVRLLAYSRPGYAGSSPRPGRSVADAAADVEAIMDALGVERFATYGWSGGGPHALACAALLGDRVRAAATLAGVAPSDAAGLDWSDGMGEENLDEFAAARGGEDALLAYLRAEAAGFARVTGPELAAAFGDLVDDVDRAALTGEVADDLAAQIRDALRDDVWGWLDDDVAFVRTWGFDLAAIAVPVAIWQGGRDRMVPAPHGPWLAEHVAGAHARLHDRHGHVSLMTDDHGEVLDDLLALAAAR